MTVLIPILVYHSVRDDPAPGFGRWTVSPAQFATHLDAVVARGQVALRITEIAAALRGEGPLPDRAMGLTFDDGFADNLRALDEVLRRGLSATLYVETGAIGTAGRLSARELTDLAALPAIELGAHSVSHPRLDELDLAEVRRELIDSKTALEQLTGRPVHSFAYPHGAHDRQSRAVVVATGYQSAAAVKNALSHPHDDPFAIARWLVQAQTPSSLVGEVLDGRKIPQAWAHERLRTRGYRVVRRARRRLAAPKRGAR